MLFVLCGVHAHGQQDAKVIAEIAAGSEKLVKNAPFSCEAVSESVQMLHDGNRIVRSSTSKLYRNSEGRFRRETSRGSGGMFGTTFSLGQGISIFDPVGGYRYLIDSQLKTARALHMKAIQGSVGTTIAKLDPEKKKAIEAKLAELKASGQTGLIPGIPAMPPSPPMAMTFPAPPPGTPMALPMALMAAGQNKFETRTEELGSRDFEGVSADGTRTVTTIPADAIGNERPIEIVYERWYSKDLELVIYSKHTDPRFGEQTYRLTNLVRSEPDPSLFTVPTGYKVLTTAPGAVYTITSAKAVTAAQAPAATAKTKP